MGELDKFEQQVFPPTDMIRLGNRAEADRHEAEVDELRNALSYAWHVVEVLAAEGQLEAQIDEHGLFMPYEFMEETLKPLVINCPPLKTRDVWQLALEVHAAYESMPAELEDTSPTLETVVV